MRYLHSIAIRFIRWYEIRELDREERCPDCSAPMSICRCEEEADLQDRMRGAYDAGWNDGLDRWAEWKDVA